MKNVALLVIDPQNDFCSPKGQLPVVGADMDMLRLSDWIMKNYMNLNNIQVTLDSHHRLHIAHAICWLGKDGKEPACFTTITAADVDNGTWRAKNPGFQKRFSDYVHQLEANKRYQLCIWPEHCLIGSEGAAIYPDLYKAMCKWESRFAVAGKVTKGSNIFTEHYSALKADVEDPGDETTKFNEKLVNLLNENDEIIVAGEALDFCVANTIRDIIEYFSPEDSKKLVLLKDCSSAIYPKGALETDFLKFFASAGGRISDTATYKF